MRKLSNREKGLLFVLGGILLIFAIPKLLFLLRFDGLENTLGFGLNFFILYPLLILIPLYLLIHGIYLIIRGRKIESAKLELGAHVKQKGGAWGWVISGIVISLAPLWLSILACPLFGLDKGDERVTCLVVVLISMFTLSPLGIWFVILGFVKMIHHYIKNRKQEKNASLLDGDS